ncbi:hypothetical protein VC52_gp33 [Pseudomonas phage vB_PaeS_PAO1_Ab18]|uniref:Uncharacterized protein n=1 Tax=Pseudomonas phage vB_PaeS_PAO1_Ab18 TaxID=1548905 RepID=A0A0A1IX01_9CAUD|nr:hypothetical protein VC52_gp33 [Pseudomonas phage vB_PaeS_PAO1_Ab18]YP_009966468.1 hydrolase, metallopeptidase [Pseudomonas phage vB_PaeS_PAO1_Ab19]CEF89672.1 hypothetical protein [Pseudomonas phage vB_PaeS_PAO1_Ab18]
MTAIRILAPLAFAAAIAVALASVLWDFLHIPEVHVSHSTGECVRMVTFEDEGPKSQDCPEKLPSRYTRVWVQ